ncbi:MAG: sulfite exporter TauE/SafE family protein, partial [Planctomycetota bacterium]
SSSHSSADRSRWFSAKMNNNFNVCRLTSRFIPGAGYPLIAGVAMGLNICPPFLLGLSRVLDMGSALKSVLFFFGFYFGSSVWLVPFIFAGRLSKLKWVQTTGRISAVLIGTWYLIKSALILIE